MIKEIDSRIKEASWIVTPAEIVSPVIIRRFSLTGEGRAVIGLSSLGFFVCYVNGKRVSDEYYRPSASNYHRRDHSKFTYPINDELTYRAYYSVYDLTQYLKEGENILEIHLGDGWYRQYERVDEGEVSFGERLGAIYALGVTDDAGRRWICSDGGESCYASAVRYSQIFYGELYDATANSGEQTRLHSVECTELHETVLTPEQAPADRIIRRLTPRLMYRDEKRRIFDTGENISGFVTLKTHAKYGEKVYLRFAENYEEGKLNFTSTGAGSKSRNGRPQIMEDVFVGDGEEHIFEPMFVWHAFRYFEVVGDGEPISVAVVHSDVPLTSSFSSSSPELNWLYDAYIRSQLDNMHCGFPSDCPHRERLGYTGDGQVCAPAAMLTLDGRNFYRKWIRDIFDSSDRVSGHVNHTAPFNGGGGGPGGWGMAAITVPYHYYKAYGDPAPVYENYEGMCAWVEYVVKHSTRGLVTSEEPGGWCLGDWCTLDKTEIPEPYVNTCLFARALRMMEQLALCVGKADDVAYFSSVASRTKAAILRDYYDATTGSFVGGIQGADAFALSCGLGDARTYERLYERYSRIGKFDTGFICTELLVEILFSHGDCDLALRMLSSHEAGGFGYMMDRGATTVWEHWLGEGSHNHPMFGGAVYHLFSWLLGITQTEGSAGYSELVIEPHIPSKLEHASAEVLLPPGRLSVGFVRRGEDVEFDITLPEGVDCPLVYGGRRCQLKSGNNRITLKFFNER